MLSKGFATFLVTLVVSISMGPHPALGASIGSGSFPGLGGSSFIPDSTPSLDDATTGDTLSGVQPWCCPLSLLASDGSLSRDLTSQTFNPTGLGGGGFECVYGDDTTCNYHQLTGLKLKDGESSMILSSRDDDTADSTESPPSDAIAAIAKEIPACPWHASFNGLKSCAPPSPSLPLDIAS